MCDFYQNGTAILGQTLPMRFSPAEPGEHLDPRPAPERAKWSLTHDAFERLLLALGPDRETGAQGYERLRRRLVKFFHWERCPEAESCADDALNRIARTLERGEEIQKIDHFALGVARLVLLEARAKARKVTAMPEDPPSRPPDGAETERALACLETCLEALPPAQKAFLLEYYHGGGRSRSDHRRKMAGDLGIDPNALRNRAMRLRERVEARVRTCMREHSA